VANRRLPPASNKARKWTGPASKTPSQPPSTKHQRRGQLKRVRRVGLFGLDLGATAHAGILVLTPAAWLRSIRRPKTTIPARLGRALPPLVWRHPGSGYRLGPQLLATAFASFFIPSAAAEGLPGLCPRQGRDARSRQGESAAGALKHHTRARGMAIALVQDRPAGEVEAFGGSRSRHRGAPTALDTVFNWPAFVQDLHRGHGGALVDSQAAGLEQPMVGKTVYRTSASRTPTPGQWVNAATCVSHRAGFPPSSATSSTISATSPPRLCCAASAT